jgi:16S rRNA (guanine966-N2)-methyltransferase
MSIKILGGVARGFPILTPRTLTTRPTSVLVRRKIFDWRQNLDEFIFIDVFAGSGAMGFEALSRGAEKIFLNDAIKSAFWILKDNKSRLEKAFHFSPSTISLSNMDAKLWVSRELNSELTRLPNVIVYIDPPYEQHQLYFEMIKFLKEKKFSGEVWLESDKLKGPKLTDLIAEFSSIIKTVEQGDHFVLLGKLV